MDTHLETSGTLLGVCVGGGQIENHRCCACARAWRGWGGGKDAASHLGRTGRGVKYPSPFNMPIRINVLSERGSPRFRWMQRSRVRGGDKRQEPHKRSSAQPGGSSSARHDTGTTRHDAARRGTTRHDSARHGASLRLRLASQRVSHAAVDTRDDRSPARSDCVMHV